MDMIQETQAAHDDFVRAAQACAMKPEYLVAMKDALEAFHAKARELDAYIQGLLPPMLTVTPEMADDFAAEMKSGSVKVIDDTNA